MLSLSNETAFRLYCLMQDSSPHVDRDENENVRTRCHVKTGGWLYRFLRDNGMLADKVTYSTTGVREMDYFHIKLVDDQWSITHWYRSH